MLGKFKGLPLGFNMDNSLKINTEGILGVSNPNMGILTQDEFNALSEDQKKKGTYFISDNNFDICTYKKDNWFVMKFYNGYIEMIYTHPETIVIEKSNWITFGSLKMASNKCIIPYTMFPETLVQHLGEDAHIQFSDFPVFAMYGGGGAALDRTHQYGIISHDTPSITVNLGYTIHVRGLWKAIEEEKE